jgi:hypothetical protein
LADLEVICEFHIIRRPRRDDAYLILLGLTWDKIYAALTRGIVRWGRGRALTEMAIIHQRVEGLFADPAKYGLCCKQLAALEQLREFPDEYRLYDEETWNSHPDTGESRGNS